MSKDPKMIYEPHPVTSERKAELRGQGYTIVDAVFAPPGVVRDDGPTVAEYVAAGYPAANYPPNGYTSRSTPAEIADAVTAQAGPVNHCVGSLAELTDEQLRAAIEASTGVAPHHKTGRAKLLEQCAALPAGSAQ